MFTREWKVRFSDVDVFGIAHYPRIIDAIHETADMFMEEIGWPFWVLTEEHKLGLPIVEVGVEFDRPVRHGDSVTIELIPEVGDSSVRFEYTAKIDDEEVFTAFEQRVCLPMGGEKSVPLPDGLREALEGYEEEDE